jgi:hypothetical protein
MVETDITAIKQAMANRPAATMQAIANNAVTTWTLQNQLNPIRVAL